MVAIAFIPTVIADLADSVSMVATGVVHALTLDNSISRGKGGWLANKVARQGEGVLNEQVSGGVGRHFVLVCFVSPLKVLKSVSVAKVRRLWAGV